MSVPALLPGFRPAPERGRAARPRLRVVEAPRHTGRFVLAILAVVVFGVVGVVSLSALAAEASFASRSLQSEVADLTLRYDELTAEVAALESPDRIRAVAEEELGMVQASSPVFLLDGTAGVPVADLADRVEPVPGD